MKNSLLKNNLKASHGFVLIAAVFLLMALSMLGIGISNWVLKGQDLRVKELLLNQARSIALGGIEWAKRQVHMGQNPTVTGKSFGSGTFDVTMLPTSPYTLTVTGRKGGATVTYTVNNSHHTSAGCAVLNTAGVSWNGNKIMGLSIDIPANCIGQATWTQAQISWAGTEMTLLDIKVGADYVYSTQGQGPGATSGTLLDVLDTALLTGSTGIHFIKYDDSHLNTPTVFTVVLLFQDGTVSSPVSFAL